MYCVVKPVFPLEKSQFTAFWLPEVVDVTVYVTAESTCTHGLAQVEQLKPTAGDQL